jgi:hypothetical protein
MFQAQYLGGRKNEKFGFYAKNDNGHCCVFYFLQKPTSFILIETIVEIKYLIIIIYI